MSEGPEFHPHSTSSAIQMAHHLDQSQRDASLLNHCSSRIQGCATSLNFTVEAQHIRWESCVESPIRSVGKKIKIGSSGAEAMAQR